MSSGFALRIENEADVRRALESRGLAAAAVLTAAVEAAAKVVQEAAIAKAPGPDIVVVQDGKSTFLVGPAKKKFYYAYFETGTGAHMVRPRSKLALKWGGDLYSAGHGVGGVGAQPFLRPAVDENVDEAGAAAGEVFAKAIE